MRKGIRGASFRNSNTTKTDIELLNCTKETTLGITTQPKYEQAKLVLNPKLAQTKELS